MLGTPREPALETSRTTACAPPKHYQEQRYTRAWLTCGLAALADGRSSLRGRLTSFVQTIDVHTGFNAPAIRVTERHDRGAIDAVQFAAGALQCLWRKLWCGTGRAK